MKHYQNPFERSANGVVPVDRLAVGRGGRVSLCIGERDLLTLAASVIGVTARHFLWQGETRWDRCSPSYSRFFIP